MTVLHPTHAPRHGFHQIDDLDWTGPGADDADPPPSVAPAWFAAMPPAAAAPSKSGAAVAPTVLYLQEPGDTAALAEALAAVLADPALASRLGAAAHARFPDWNRTAAEWADCMGAVVEAALH